jgi:hypothetical protein
MIVFVKQLLAVRDLSDAIAPELRRVRWTTGKPRFWVRSSCRGNLTAFEIEAFFTFTLAERQLIEDRRRPTLKLGLSLQIGFLRMSGRLLDAVPMVPRSVRKLELAVDSCIS